MDNSAQIEYWNSAGSQAWVDEQVHMDAQLEPLSALAVTAAAAQPGERVIDIGCGCGATSLSLADSGAQVWGVDVSAPMLALARQRASGRDNLVFSEADAAVQHYTADHDLVFSRFGVMFFADPIAAFTNIKTALNEDGRLVFICWRAPRENPWMSVVGREVQPLLPQIGPPPEPRMPGPFAFVEQAWLEEILATAGFRAVQIDAVDETLRLGADLDEALYYLSKIGPLARGLGDLDEARRQHALSVARAALEPYQRDQGVMLGAGCWLVQARA